jgi:nucleotidyltransferase/DNA polymerase involved in DNA repair
MQTNLQLANKDQVKRTWAFAVDPSRRNLKRRSLRRLNHAVITACSKEARTLGIRAGMRYEEAKQLLPDLRILVYGVNHARE